MTPSAKYLYCVIRCSEEHAFQDVAPLGAPLGPVHTVPHNGLAAVVSDCLQTELETSRANLLAHQRVLERVMREFPLLPVRFGTVASPPAAEEDIQKLLSRRSQEFAQLLADLEGKVELGLKALWRDEHALFEEVLAENPALRGLRDALRGKPPQATHFERMRLGEMVRAALERKRAAVAQSLLAPLRPLACRIVENPALLDRLMVNAAFLVERGREEEFDQVVSKLEGEWGQRILFKYVGPVPPYNFVNISVNWEDL